MQILENKDFIFYALLIAALFLTRIPLLGKYFRSVNTLVHEAGHAFATLLLSGEVIAVNLFADTSGTTVTKAKSKLAQFIIAFAGYPLSSIMAIICMLLIHKEMYLYVLFLFTSIALVLLILSLKNAYGLFWAGTFITLNLLFIYFNNKLLVFGLAAFYSLILLTDSVISALVVFTLSIKQPKKAGDTTNLNKITKIPAFFWGFIFIVIAISVAYITVINYFPPIEGLLKSF